MSTVHRAPLCEQAWALLRLRCPVCLEGPLFRSLMRMRPDCPGCGVAYAREHGCYLSSMLIAYAPGFLVLVPSAVLLALREVSIGLFAIVIIVETLIIWPLIFTYARSIRLHLDQVLDPRMRPPES